MNQKILIQCSENKMIKGIMTLIIGFGFMAIDLKNIISSDFRISLFDHVFFHVGLAITTISTLFLFSKKICRIDPEIDERIMEIGFMIFGFVPILRKVKFKDLECRFNEAKTRSEYFDTWSVKLNRGKKDTFSWSNPTIGEFEYEQNAEDLVQEIEQAYKNANKAVILGKLDKKKD